MKREHTLKVRDFEVDYPGSVEWGGSQEAPDLMRCTRCDKPWGYTLVERIEMWKCGHCGYEAREKSSDFRRILIARQESMIS